MFTHDTIVLIGLSFLASGVIKGLTGIGFITICISFLVFLVDLKSAISMIFFSSVLSNLAAMRNAGHFTQTLKKFYPLYIMVLPGLALGVSILINLEEAYLLQCLAVAIFLFCAFMVFRPEFKLSNKVAQLCLAPVGLVHGFIAGLTGTQSVPLIPFVLSMKLDTKQTLQALNTTMTLGTILTGIFLYSTKIMTNDLLMLSALFVLPTFAGVSLGNYCRSKLSAEAFRVAALLALFGIGVSLTWKSSNETISAAYFSALQVAKASLNQAGLWPAPDFVSGEEPSQTSSIADRSNGRASFFTTASLGSAPPPVNRWRFIFIEPTITATPHHSGDTERQATSSEVKELRRKISALKEALADVLLENRLLKKSMISGGDDHE